MSDASRRKVLSAPTELVIAADDDVSGFGDIIFKTGGVERARIGAGGVGTGVLGGGMPFLDVDPRARWLGVGLERALAAQDSLGLAVLSDSTGNDVPSGSTSGDWPYELALLLAAEHPEYTVRHRLFADGTQDYAAPTVIQTGTDGARYARFAAGANSLLLNHDDITAFGATEDLDIAVKVSLDDWTPAAITLLACHFFGAGTRSWRFYVNTAGNAGKLVFEHSADGTALISHSSTVVVGATDGAVKWVRATLDVDNGAAGHDVKFYTSDDGVTWVQLGATVTTAGTTSVFDAAYPWEIGARGGTTDVLTGNIYEVQLRRGILGPIIAPCLPEQWDNVKFGSGGAGTEPVITGAPILEIVNGSVAGQGLAYLSDATRITKLLPPYALRAVFMATMHNDHNATATSGGRGANLMAKWKTWLTAVKAQAYAATPVVVTENPRLAAAGNVGDQARLREMLLALAGQQGIPAIDAYQAFAAKGDYSAYINADGIHPALTTGVTSRTGAQVWADYAYAALFG